LNKAKIIHIHYTHPWPSAIYPFLKLKFKIVHTLHDVSPHIGEEKIRNKLGILLALKYADALIVHGKVLKDRLVKEFNIPDKKIFVIPMGNWNVITRFGNNDLKEEPKTILFAGRILPYKGLNILLEAFKDVLINFPNARLIISGPGDISPYMNLINSMKNNLEVNNYTLSDEDFADCFRRSSIVVIPYIEGSQSGPLLLACSFGKAIVCTNVGAFGEVIQNGVNGLLIEPNNSKALSDAIKTFLSDEELRKKMGAKAKEKANVELGWEKIALQNFEIYKNLIQEQNS
jgi:glycosyltransferase involved in cell wall biosynthesis